MSRSDSNATPGQLLLSGARGAAENMAIDQALLQQVDHTRVPVLRIYSWNEPTLSLGYFQRYEDRNQHRESESVHCVRRATGGGAILHEHDLTYSIVMPIRSTNTQARLTLYRQMHELFIRVLSSWNVRLDRHVDAVGKLGSEHEFLCFQRRTEDDLVCSGYKVLGSAQRRTRGAVLQHGSLLIQSSRYAPQLPGIIDLTSLPIRIAELTDHLVQTASTLLGIDWETQHGESVDAEKIDTIVRDRFGSASWNRRR